MKCQKCRSTIKLHGSLEDTSPASFQLLLGAPPPTTATPNPLPHDRLNIYSTASGSSTSANPPVRRGFPSSSTGTQRGTASQAQSIYGSQNPAESFVMLTESQLFPPRPSLQQDTPSTDEDTSRSSQLHRAERLFEILSARTDIDHPICQECSELLIEGYTKRLQNAVRERDGFVEFAKQMQSEIPSAEEQAKADAELQRLRAEDAAAMTELKALEDERAEADAEIKRLEAELEEVGREEEQFWRERNAFSSKLEEFQNLRDGVNLQYDHDSKQLEKLQRTNVFNDTFCIGHEGAFGTINNLRLGRLPNQPVEWSEINAAWGQTLLLLATVAEKLGFTFDGYRLRPMGSTSRIDKLDISESTGGEPRLTTLELFSSGDIPLGRMFLHRKFDMAMVAFLECLRQLGEYVVQRDPQLRMPYTIVKDKIGDVCIRLAFNQDEAWTKACKYTLTCVKFLLAHTR
ncbi:autophagy protein Apg6-domain-containing protein [Pyronema omphalodes]|nr:autophagy protein Apg6-domain-containing protein [Pyronema omphalodes]